jgi:uncharacterized protein YndB with AHSA1/START domain
VAAGSKTDLVITRIFDAPRSLVFKMWTDPVHLAKWWGPRGFTNPRCEVDPRPGGIMRIDMRGPDGTIYPMTGTIDEIVEPERIVMTNMAMADEAGNPLLLIRNTITFTEANGKTTLTMTAHVLKSTPEAEFALSGMEAGWNQTLERLGELLATL